MTALAKYGEVSISDLAESLGMERKLGRDGLEAFNEMLERTT